MVHVNMAAHERERRGQPGSGWNRNAYEFPQHHQLHRPHDRTSAGKTRDPPPQAHRKAFGAFYGSNHGEYASGAARAGLTGKAPAAIAKDMTLVGPYKG
jgi:hypothetical protein